MLLLTLVRLLVSTLSALFSGLSNVVTIPTDLLTTLSTITGYGAYFVGGDLLLIFFSMIYFWMLVKASIGLSLFLWRLLPLT